VITRDDSWPILVGRSAESKSSSTGARQAASIGARDFSHYKNRSRASNAGEALAHFEPDVVHIQISWREITIEVRELIDSEVEAVVGGAFDFGNAVFQQNNATQVGLALGGLTLGSAGNAAVAQQLGQANVSTIA